MAKTVPRSESFSLCLIIIAPRTTLISIPYLFGGKMKNKKDAAQEEKDALLKVIGQQKVELDFLKKALA